MVRTKSQVKSGAHSGKPLSGREQEIVQLVAQAYCNKEVAQKLSISEQTVKNHLYKIFGKVGIFERRKLGIYAIHRRLIDKPNANLSVESSSTKRETG